VRLPDGAVFASDALWISEDRRPAVLDEDRDGFARIAPDIAFEMLSVNDDLRDMRTKANAYLANGTRLVVLLDTRSRSAELHRPGGNVDARIDVTEVDLDPELPGFRLDVASIFKDMRDRHLMAKSSDRTDSSRQNIIRKP
jgi:Uma2 family endonuclease